MNRYITKICVNRLFHLGGFEIPVADDAFPHLIITGRSGSGKTVLLNPLDVNVEEEIVQDIDFENGVARF